jgi:predicted nucleic acid-binding protein
VEKRGQATLSGASFAILDTSIYIDNLRSGRFKQEILDLPFVVRCSAVVLAELSRGARSRDMKKFVDDMERNLRVITPTEGEWTESGRIVSRIAAAKHYDANKTREIHFDVLIAMSARQIGAVLITRNAADFKAVREFMRFNLVFW